MPANPPMPNTDDTLTDKMWRAKLAARLHDPAGHENGTSRALTRLLGLHEADATTLDPDNDEALVRTVFKNGIPASLYRHVQRADWWAAAADRPQWPMQEITVTTRKGDTRSFAIAPWAQVRWTNKPVLTHPLTGEQYDLSRHGGLGDTDFHDIKQRSFDHTASLLAALEQQNPGAPSDWRKLLLTLWRFAPELREQDDHGKLGALWPLLPADTRIPDHSIWDHLDLTSAFAGAFAADPQGEVALLTLSIGPVQGFIAAARSTSDLWAGSHLLSRLAWEVMRPLAEELGPDAILFPRLRGIGQVDLWLQQMGLPKELFKDCAWQRGSTDANPLFAAALPNRFVAIVPASRAQALAEQATAAVRAWLQATGKQVVDELLKAADMAAPDAHAYAQMREQLEGFPEVHWAAVPFSLIGIGDVARQHDLDTTTLQAAQAPFFGTAPEVASGFLASEAWQVLQKELAWGDGTTFFAPNPGVLYPAIHELAERTLAVAKSVRSFEPLSQDGWRCALTGESEWLTTDPEQLKHSYRQQKDTLWARLHELKYYAWVKEGEHLGGLAALKRLWPTLFAREVAAATGKPHVDRFVVSTHTMALVHQIENWLVRGGLTASGFAAACEGVDSVALPRRLLERFGDKDSIADAKRLPALLDRDDDREADDATRRDTERLVKQTLGVKRLETYYSLIMLDGDRMGAILAGDAATKTAITYRESFHPAVRAGFDQHAARQPRIKQYGDTPRAVSPNRHLAISGALNDFSQHVVPHVVEREHLGRVLYAGGDDVLAMLPVADMLPAMQRLRHAYSGEDPAHEGGRDPRGLTLSQGFAYLDRRLMRMMGKHATASCGAVVAHHQAPLGAVLRELRAAEQRAKNEGGRNAFSLTVIKRGGGALYLTAKWGEPVALLNACMDFLRADGTSRRAVYNSLEWLHDLPEPDDATRQQMLAELLAYQLDRQAKGSERAQAPDLAQRLATLAADECKQGRRGLRWLENFLSVAEFLARETRTGDAA